MNIWTKIGLILLLIALALFAWLYLTGGIFLSLVDLDYNNATPLTAFNYWHYYSDDSYVMDKLMLAGGISVAILIIPFIAFLIPAKRSLYGNARFAKKSEIVKSGLLDGEGVIVGKYQDKYLQLKGQLHVILSAPTRSGKGVGVVIPNLLSWKYSVVVLDIKQENWDITSAFRKKHGQKCFLFNPLATDYRTHRYNPLSYIDHNPDFRINDIQKIANMLFPDRPNTDPIWTSTPRSFFLGVVLFMMESGKVLTIGQVLRESLNDGDGSTYFKKAIKDASEAGSPYSGACVRALNSYIGIASENTRAGIITGFRSALELWMNPIIDAATNGNDFDLRKVREEKISIYVGVTPDNLERVAPLLNLFFQQLIDLNTRELPHQNKNIKHDCLLLMDEFTAIGKIPILAKGISYIAGYGLRMLPIIQSPSQLVDVYGKEAAETFTVNHALNIVFPPKATETNTAKDISEWLGYDTVDGVATSKGKSIFNRRDPSENTSDQRRALLLPQEITSLDSEKEIVVFENLPPILATKVRYFKDDIFLKRLQSASPFLANLKSLSNVKKELIFAITSGFLAADVPKIKLNNLGDDTDYDMEQFNDETTETIEKQVTAKDILDIHNKNLADFSVDFSDINPPEGKNMDEQALRDYADKLCQEAGILVKTDASETNLQEL
jgi:type IV secretion system protein VirD4|tara:strand:- start:17850 stop:19850 length:2001 start_codon:yes stop_codon:yes gene_type:complete